MKTISRNSRDVVTQFYHFFPIVGGHLYFYGQKTPWRICLAQQAKGASLANAFKKISFKKPIKCAIEQIILNVK